MRKKLLMTLLALIGGGSVWADGYRVGFDTSLELSNAARRINSVKLNDDTKAIGEDNKMYRDLHETVVFEVAPGATVTPGFVLNGGGWMHGLVYVDLNQNGDFATYDGDSFTLDEGENVANSASSGNIGANFSCGSFTAPTTAGDYRMRFKVDWNGGDPRALNPAGRIGNNGTYASNDGNSIVANSGSIVDVTLRVVNDFSKVTFTFDGVATGSTTIDVKNGTTPTLPVSIPSYVEYAVTPELAAVNGDVTYTVTTSYNQTMPFTPNDASCYNLNINRNPNLKVYTEGEEIKTVAGTAVNYENQNNFMWQFEGDWLNGFKLKNKAADKYVTFGSADPANKYKATLTDAPAAGAFYDLVISGDKNYFKIHGTTTNAYISNNGGAGTSFLTNWNSANNIGDGGAQILISEATVIPFDLTAIKAEAIASLPSISALYADADLATATSAINSVTCGADEASINAALAAINSAKVAYMKAAEGKKVAFKSLSSYSTRGGDYYLTAEAAGTQMTSNTELTKFGVYELTYNEGANAYTVKALANDTYLPKTGGASTAIATTDDAANAGLYTLVGTDNADGRVVVTNTNGSGISDSQGGIHLDGSKKIVVWGPTGAASNWNIETISDEDYNALLNALDWAAFETLVNELQAVTIGGGLGQYTTGDPMMDAYAPNYIEEFASYLDDKENTDAEDFEYAMEAMQGIKDNMTLNLPQAGMFVTIKGKTSGKYIHNDGTTGTNIVLGEDADATTIWYVGEGNKLVNYSNGLYMAGGWQVAVGGAADTYTFSAGNAAGCYYVKPSSKNYLIDWTDGKANYWSTPATAPDGRCNWVIEEVSELPVTISAAGYSTLYAPVALTVPAGVKAYTLAQDGDYLVATEVSTIAANTAVVLQAEAGSYDFAIAESADAQTSCLGGTIATQTAPASCYTLANGSEGIGFYKYTGETVKGFKAYFENTTGVKGFALSFTEADAIKAVEAAQAGNVYDLNGRKVVKAQKGIFIQNGKKVVK